MHRERKLLVPQRDYMARGAEPILRSGLYIIRTPTTTSEEQTFVLYWPEDTTWDDNAVWVVQRNRVTFMRYGPILTQHCSRATCREQISHQNMRSTRLPTVVYTFESDSVEGRRR
jgi:hypothetical protein